MSYLLDTNIVSELGKRTKNPGVLDWLAATHPSELFLSVLTIGELYRGVTRLRDRGDARQADAVARFVIDTQENFASHILPITHEVACEWGKPPYGRNTPTIDGLIAATAVVHGATVVTRNVKDFESTGTRVLNPFTG